MEQVKFELSPQGDGRFYVTDESESLGEMVVGISGNTMTVYHTEVAPRAEGRGLAKQMLDTMVGYARDKGLKVLPLCPYVHAQFRRHSKDYSDIWQKEEN